MPLDTEINLGPADVVLDGVAASPWKGHSPQFLVHVYCGQTAGWMKTPLGTEVDLGPGHIVLDGDSALPAKGAQQPTPVFGVCLLWPQSPILATDELLFEMRSYSYAAGNKISTDTARRVRRPSAIARLLVICP